MPIWQSFVTLGLVFSPTGLRLSVSPRIRLPETSVFPENSRGRQGTSKLAPFDGNSNLQIQVGLVSPPQLCGNTAG